MKTSSHYSLIVLDPVYLWLWEPSWLTAIGKILPRLAALLFPGQQVKHVSADQHGGLSVDLVHPAKDGA